MDAVLGFLHSAMPVLAFIWGLACKYLPALKNVPNAAIPWINALAFIITGLGAPAEAHAAGFLGIGGSGFLGMILGGCWQSIQTSLVYEIMGRHPLEKGLGWAKPR